MNRFEKLRIHLRGYALGKSWYRLIQVVEIANLVHIHTRKDGVTPEFQHQMEIASYLISIGIDTESLLITAILHDLPEDYPAEWSHFQAELNRILLPEEIESIEALNKNSFRSTSEYYDNMPRHLICSLVKGADRINNVQTMLGVFSEEKIKKYILESETYVLPMLKSARRQHPKHTAAFFNIEIMLKNQLGIYKFYTAKDSKDSNEKN